jgi:beta-glucanase (GH16 family)
LISVQCLVAGTLIAGLGYGHSEWQFVWGGRIQWQLHKYKALDVRHRHGNNGWGNRELEHYPPHPDNGIVADGMLHIVARKETYQGKHFTSAKFKTCGLFSQKYGRFEFYARLPQGQGYWPLFG